MSEDMPPLEEVATPEVVVSEAIPEVVSEVVVSEAIPEVIPVVAPLPSVAPLPPSSIDVHIFDGHLRDMFKPKEVVSPEEKKRLFTEFHDKLSDNRAKMAVQLIIANINNANVQRENNADSSDILVEIIKHKDCGDLLPLIQEQLADIVMGGSCPSGRVTRLFQIWSSLST